MALREHALDDAELRTAALVAKAAQRTQLRSDAICVLAVFLAFATGAVLSWESFGSWEGPSFFYPSAGVTVAAMMLSRRGLWPWIAVAVMVAEVLVDTIYGSPLWVSGGFAVANVVEPLVGATLVLAWCGGRPDLSQRRDFVGFVAGACLIAPIFSALIGGSLISVHYESPWLVSTVTWWTGDALGVLVMASPILLWSTQSEAVRRRPWEMAAVLAITSALSVATFWTDLPPSILILPTLAWAGFRLNMIGAAIAGAAAAFLANIMTTHGRGLFVEMGASREAQVVLTQTYVAVIVVVALLIAQEAAGRQDAVREREAERRERLRLETLSRLAIELAAALTPEDIGRALVEQVLNEAGAQGLILGLVGGDGRFLECAVMSGYPTAIRDKYAETGIPLRERAVATDTVRLGRPIEFHNFAEYAAAYPDNAGLAAGGGMESVVGWPLNSGGQSFGVLVLAWTRTQPLDTAQRAYISAVATMVSQALVRAKIYADERARAAVLHSVAQPVARADAVGIEYRALYRPADAAHRLGGDWYSVMALPDRRTYLAIGDVVGHGLLSVEDMAQLRTTGNAYAHQGLSAAQILTELNRFAASQIRGDFATNLVAIFDPGHSSLSYGSAGHLPPLLRRAATGKVMRLSDASGPMLGPFPETVYVQNTIAVEAGDVLVMYTDGLVEHYDEDLKTGIAHLENVLAAWPPEALLDCEALARDVAPAPHDDDLCLLIVRFGADNGDD
ncbi:MAG: SpoIIE family protein phosphatase [Mycobacterium sp.]